MPFSENQPNRGRLLVIGGAERRDPNDEILGHFMNLAGGRDARLLVCAAASREPLELLEEYDHVFRELGAAEVWGEAMQDRRSCEAPGMLEKLEQATAVFFTGGDQFRLTSTVAGTAFSGLLQDRYEQSALTVAGTSAGATAMGSIMIMGPSGGRVRRSDVDVGVGLGFLRETIIDSHFNERSRINRLLTVFAQNPQILGIGIDENTAVDMVPGGLLRVLGTGAVTVLDGRVSYSNAAEVADDEVLALSGVTLHVLPRGYAFDARSRQLITPPAA